MKDSSDPAAVRRKRILIAAAAFLVGVGAVAASALLRPDPEPAPHSSQVPERAEDRVGFVAPSQAPARPASIVESRDPAAFARAVAVGLFDWDTASMTQPADYAQRLLEVGDPTGEETVGLAGDVANYLPTDEAWAVLRQYRTRQWLEVTSVEQPTLWDQAVAEAGPDGLLPGTTAYTVEGVRHRSGVWEDEPVTSQYDVAFTVFVVCAPSYPTCRLLRLSILDKPLR